MVYWNAGRGIKNFCAIQVRTAGQLEDCPYIRRVYWLSDLGVCYRPTRIR